MEYTQWVNRAESLPRVLAHSFWRLNALGVWHLTQRAVLFLDIVKKENTLFLHFKYSFDKLTLKRKNLRQYVSSYFQPWLGARWPLPAIRSSLSMCTLICSLFFESEFKVSHGSFLFLLFIWLFCLYKWGSLLLPPAPRCVFTSVWIASLV